jgi:hypothetical protein
MRRFRFSIGSVLLLVLVLAVGFAALRAATALWDSALLGGSIVLLLTSALLVVHRRLEKRAFWLGFSIFGWAYLLASLIAPVESRLPTSKLLAFLDTKWPKSVGNTFTFVDFDADGTLDLSLAGMGALFRSNGNGTFVDVTQSTAVPPNPPAFTALSAVGGSFVGTGSGAEHFVRIGHSLVAVLLACLGGLLSRSLARQNLVPADARRDRADSDAVRDPAQAIGA